MEKNDNLNVVLDEVKKAQNNERQDPWEAWNDPIEKLGYELYDANLCRLVYFKGAPWEPNHTVLKISLHEDDSVWVLKIKVQSWYGAIEEIDRAELAAIRKRLVELEWIEDGEWKFYDEAN